jgi:hypothetical protein
MHFFLVETQKLIPIDEKKLKKKLDKNLSDCIFAM